jgi:subtilisin family serine protease
MKHRFGQQIAIVLAVVSATLLASCGNHRRLPTSTSGSASAGGTVHRAPATYLEGFDYSDKHIAGNAVVVFKPGVNVTSYYAAHDLTEISNVTFGSKTYRLLKGINANAGSTTLADDLLSDPVNVDSAQPDRELYTTEGSGDPMSFDDSHVNRSAAEYANTAVLDLLRATQAHNTSGYQGGTNVHVGILDTGIDRTHPLWSASPPAAIVMRPNFAVIPEVSGSTASNDGVTEGVGINGRGHGTHVAGIVHFVAPNATLDIFKVLRSDGRGTAFGLAKAIKYACSYVQVINLSLGLLVDDPIVHDACIYAYDHNVAVIASAGNRGVDEPQWPAAYDEVIAVTATDNNDHLASFATYGTWVDASAPGVDIVSAFPQGMYNSIYASASGTSMATPIFSGAVALARGFPGNGTCAMPGVARFVSDFSTNVDNLNDPGVRGKIGHGRVDLPSILQEVVQ